MHDELERRVAQRVSADSTPQNPSGNARSSSGDGSMPSSSTHVEELNGQHQAAAPVSAERAESLQSQQTGSTTAVADSSVRGLAEVLLPRTSLSSHPIDTVSVSSASGVGVGVLGRKRSLDSTRASEDAERRQRNANRASTRVGSRLLAPVQWAGRLMGGLFRR